MSDTMAVSALNGASFEGFASVRELGLRGMIAVRGDLSSPQMAQAVRDAAGVGVPERGTAAAQGDCAAAWMSPDELLVMVPHAEAGERLGAISAALAGTHHLAANVSDARAMFEVAGKSAREVVSKLCPVDMHPDAFPPGRFRRTRMAQIPAALWQVDAETVRVLCFRSVAGYAFGLLANAAKPGSEIGALPSGG